MADSTAAPPAGASSSLPDSAPKPESDQAPVPQINDDHKYIRIRRSHFFAALIPIAFAAGLAYGYFLWGRDRGQLNGIEGELSTGVARVQVDTDDDPSLGPADAPVTIVEFSDFNCPYCRAWNQQVFRPLLDSYPDQIRFVYRDFPIVGGGSIGLSAAQAANCAAEQQAYWEYHDALFSGTYSLDQNGYLAAAESLGLDPDALSACLESGRNANEPRADLRYGASLGVTGTPTFFINGIPLVGAQPLSSFAEVIDSELGR